VAYDEELANRVRTEVSGIDVTERAMFGGLTFLINGNMSVTVSGKGGLMVRVPPADSDDLLTEPGVSQVEMGGRGPMSGWLRVDNTTLDDDAALRTWVRRSVEFASTLPAK
jgi:TfoX/Sxy family transcriptional regulator of competence genes